MLKLGVECENLEDVRSRWGVGQLVLNLLEEYAKNPELQKKFKLYLYFKNKIPDDEVLKNPLLIKRIAHVPSFNLFYHIFMPLRAMVDNLDYMFFPAYMLPPLYLRKSIVMLTNDVYYEYTRGTLPFRYKLAYRLFSNWAAVKAKKILAISEASRDELVKIYGIEPKRIFVNHLGVDSFRTLNHRPKTKNYLLYVGQMFPRRHARESIFAFKRIAKEFPDLNFILIGKDKYPPSKNQKNISIIDDLVGEVNKELGRERIIHYNYIDRREDMEKLYAGAKLFVYVSHSEAFGLPPVEAASYGIPVVVADNVLNHELFGDAGFFVKNAGSPDEISDKMREGLIDEEKRNYCIEKYKTIIPQLSWYNFTKNFFDNLEK